MQESDNHVGSELHDIDKYQAHLREQLCTSVPLDKHVTRTRHTGALGMIDAV